MDDQFVEWDRFMEVYERSGTADRAMETYKKERNTAELRSYQRDVRRGHVEPPCKHCRREWWQEHAGSCPR